MDQTGSGSFAFSTGANRVSHNIAGKVPVIAKNLFLIFQEQTDKSNKDTNVSAQLFAPHT